MKGNMQQTLRITSNTKLETDREQNNYSKFSIKSPT